MRISKGRAMGMGLAAIAILATIPSLLPTSAKKAPVPFPGAISITAPSSNAALSGGSSHVSWSWKPGALAKSTSVVDFQVTRDGSAWQTIAAGIPIRDGGLTWNTKQADDAVYSARVIIERTTLASAVNPLYVDNTAPQVTVTHPSQSEILVENDTKVYFTVVVGSAELDAAAFDALSGIDHVTWQLDKTDISAKGIKTTYNFSGAQPGFHDLTATAYDRAGNSSVSDSVKLFTAPGPSGLGTLPSPCPLQTNPLQGTPADPCTLPTTPPSPPTAVPSSCPQAGGAVDPCSKIPNGVSVPGSCSEPNPAGGSVDPCAQIPNPGATPSPVTVPSGVPTPKSVPCQTYQPSTTDPTPHCTITT